MHTVTNPHDKLFQEILGREPEARSFLEQYLPEPVARLVDLDRLDICKDSFVDEELKLYYSDLLYRVQLAGEPGYIYLLFEHKSYPDRLVPLQLLEYMLKIWRLHLGQQRGERSRTLPVIVPLLVYHGTEPWPYQPRLTNLMAGPPGALAAYIPDFTYVVTDLTGLPDDAIKGTVVSRVFALVLKHIFDPDIRPALARIFELLRDVEQQPSGVRALETFLRYIYSAAENISPNDVTALARKALTARGEQHAMTIAQQLEQRGYDQGMQQGMQQGMREGLLEAIELGLQLKFGVAGERVFPAIAGIQDLIRLKSIKNSIPLIQELSELDPLLDETFLDESRPGT